MHVDVNRQSTISLLRVVNESGFYETIKENNYKMTAGYFYNPHDNPFSFEGGYFIAFQSSYLTKVSEYMVLGISTSGNVECKLIQLE